MPAGDAFTALQRHEIAKAVADAERVSGRTFSVHVGPSEGAPREYAESLHAQLADPAHSILIHVDPAGHALEIVTGAVVRRSLSQRSGRVGRDHHAVRVRDRRPHPRPPGRPPAARPAGQADRLLHTNTP